MRRNGIGFSGDNQAAENFAEQVAKFRADAHRPLIDRNCLPRQILRLPNLTVLDLGFNSLMDDGALVS